MMWEGGRFGSDRGQSRRISSRADFFDSLPLPEDPFKEEKLKIRKDMALLGIRIMPNSGVWITRVVTDKQWVDASKSELSVSVKATIQLDSAKPMSDERRERLKSASVKRKKKWYKYYDLRSASRAGDHIVVNTLNQAFVLDEMIENIRKKTRRINDMKGMLNSNEINAKIDALQEIADKLEGRNLISKRDPLAEAARNRIEEAITLLEDNKWYLACPDLYSAFTTLSKKFIQYERWAEKNIRNTDVLDEYIKLRQEMINYTREELSEIKAEIDGASRRERDTLDRLDRAKHLLQNLTYAAEAATCLKGINMPEIGMARGHIFDAVYGRVENELNSLNRASYLISEAKEKIQAKALMPTSARANLHNRLADLSLMLRDSSEMVFRNASELLGHMALDVWGRKTEGEAGKEILKQDLGMAGYRANEIMKLLNRAEEYTGEKK